MNITINRPIARMVYCISLKGLRGVSMVKIFRLKINVFLLLISVMQRIKNCKKECNIWREVKYIKANLKMQAFLS